MLKKKITEEHVAVNLEERANELRRDLLHDINSAVHTLQGCYDLIRKLPPDSKDKIRHYLSAAKDANEHLKQLNSQLESVIETSNTVYSPGPTELVRVVESSLRMCSGILNGTTVNYTPYSEPLGRKELYFVGDGLRMKQVMINIFSNMARELKDVRGADISVSVETGKDIVDGVMELYAKITIGNNGPHFRCSPEEVFIPERSESNSSGLGMAICRHIVEEMFNGSITADNLPGKGVYFEISLPLYTEPTGKIRRP